MILNSFLQNVSIYHQNICTVGFINHPPLPHDCKYQTVYYYNRTVQSLLVQSTTLQTHTNKQTRIQNYRLLLGHVRNSPLILHRQHRYLPQLLFLGLLQDFLLPLCRQSRHHLLLKGFILSRLDLDCVIVLLLDLQFLVLWRDAAENTHHVTWCQ